LSEQRNAILCKQDFTYKVSVDFRGGQHEKFSLAFFALSKPIWVRDLGTEPKNPFFYHLTPDFESFFVFWAY
jgi:hypothetical protein